MIIVGILLFALLVVVHEYGHFIAARRNGVEVDEFGIGFPPKLFGKKIGETEYTFNLIPLGGFVKLKGEGDSDQQPGSFGASSFWTKAKILLAGVGMNLVAAVAILTVLALTSMPQILPGQYRVETNEIAGDELVVAAQVGTGSAAEEAGMMPGDAIIRINDVNVESAEALSEITESLRGQQVTLHVERKGESMLFPAQLGADEGAGYLGVAPIDLTTSRYTWAAPIVAVGVTLQTVGLVLLALWNIVIGIFSGTGGEAAAQLTGPVGIVFLLQNLGNFGFEYLLFLIASISVSLAVFNALPIPALDGGRLAVITAARAMRRRVDPGVESAIHGLGFLLLIGLFIVITYVDVQRFF